MDIDKERKGKMITQLLYLGFGVLLWLGLFRQLLKEPDDNVSLKPNKRGYGIVKSTITQDDGNIVISETTYNLDKRKERNEWYHLISVKHTKVGGWIGYSNTLSHLI